MANLIDRQAAIEIVKRIKMDSGFEAEKWMAINKLRDLPSAQPHVTETNVGDIISRRAAIDYLMINMNWYDEDGCRIEDADEKRKIITDLISGVPSAEPERKTGRWQITDAYPHSVYCSECHVKFAQTHWAVWEDGSLPRKYCPNCGAKIEEVHHETD